MGTNRKRFFSAYLACAILSGCAQTTSLTQSDENNTTTSDSRRKPIAEKPDNLQTPPAVTRRAKNQQTSASHTTKQATKQTSRQITKQPPDAPASEQSATIIASDFPAIALDKPFKVKYGQKRRLPNSDLSFKISKVSDNRCPLEMHCIHNSKAVVTLTLYRQDERIDVLTISGDDTALPGVQYRQYTYRFRLLDLQPYPTVQFIDLQHYIAELIITKTANR